ncbi:MAG: hypothetical protein H6739_21265 [Alphaproteobacteria bacterium]|nr:hypothetical protein [Alphaproteobacteria bacterium]
MDGTRHRVRFKREADERWSCEVTGVEGARGYGASEAEALENALILAGVFLPEPGGRRLDAANDPGKA